MATVNGREGYSTNGSAAGRFRLVDVPDVHSTPEIAAQPPISKSRFPPSRDRRILYEDFRAKYWPHFPQNSTKGLGLSLSACILVVDGSTYTCTDPALVWNEFQGVIRGSERSLENPNGSLDRETYEGLSHRTQATFSRHRPRLYDIFEAYAKLKREKGEVDLADR